QEGLADRLGTVLTAAVVDGDQGKEYRLPVEEEIAAAAAAEAELTSAFADIPFAVPREQIGEDAKRNTWCVQYGIRRFADLFSPRQLLALAAFLRWTRGVSTEMRSLSYDPTWVEGCVAHLALVLDRLVDRSSMVCRPEAPERGGAARGVINTFSRFALPMFWDFVECVPASDRSGGYPGASEWVAKVAEHTLKAQGGSPPTVIKGSATRHECRGFDAIITDPPYYDAIGYSVLMDFFHVWLRRTVDGLSPEIDEVFREPLGPKWSHETNDGELIDDASRFDGDRTRSKQAYEDGMFRAFLACDRALKPDGRMVVVFANKQPNAWEALVSAIIRAGFVVDGSWPIQTEMSNRTRALSSAALASSVWLVCRKRPETARPGWDNQVLAEMRERIGIKLREFWDAGIRGPDFVWAGTGPALEAYSKHPVVKKANAAGELMSVSEFLRAVRRIVVDFVVGRVLSHDGDSEAAAGLDDVTTYYLLHRYDFGLKDTPVGPCILYAVSCGLSDHDLADQHDILQHTGGQVAEEEGDEEEGTGDEEATEGTGNTVRLRDWKARRRPSMGYDPAVDSARARAAAVQPSLFPEDDRTPRPSRIVPLIDQIHRLMHLWSGGDVVKVDEYLELRALRRNRLFAQVLQALIELAEVASEERSLLEKLSNHGKERGAVAEDPRRFLPGLGDNSSTEGS
ncbi:MAG: hypothetical protein MUF10_11205, partial [Thermoanaerobaculaceae bacterium]|nr:hypothetical protein [Thermoanaerobaculaceae bacterium]